MLKQEIMKVIIKKHSAGISGPIKVPKDEIRRFNGNVLFPLRAATSFATSNDKSKRQLALKAVVELHRIGMRVCLALSQIPVQTLKQVPRIQEGFPATISSDPWVQKKNKTFLRDLNIGNSWLKRDVNSPALKIAESNIHTIRLLQKSKHTALIEMRGKCPFTSEIVKLPKLNGDTWKEWWAIMLKLYRYQAQNNPRPLGNSFTISDKELISIVKPYRSKSRTAGKDYDVRSKYLEKVRFALSLIAKSQ